MSGCCGLLSVVGVGVDGGGGAWALRELDEYRGRTFSRAGKKKSLKNHAREVFLPKVY